MSTLVGLEQDSEAETTMREERLASRVLQALSDDVSRKILLSAVSKGRTVTEISAEQTIPLSTCHRKTRELFEQGLLVVERIVLKPEGTKSTLYRSSFKTIGVSSDFRMTYVSVEWNEVAVKRFREGWPSEHSGSSAGSSRLGDDPSICLAERLTTPRLR